MSLNSPFTTKKERGAYSAIVYKDGDLYVVEDNVGASIKESTTAHTSITAALSALSSGRTWQERVILQGTFDLGDTIDIPSYTILDLQEAEIKLATSIDKSIIQCDTNRHYITVLGGLLDGNKVNQTTGWGIVFRYTSDHIAIIGTIIKDVKVHGITLVDVEKSLVRGVRVQDSGGDGIQLYYDNEKVIVSNCICVNNDDTGFVVERSTQINLINNIAKDSGYNGIIIYAGTYNNIIGNHAISNSRLYTDYHGIFLGTLSAVKSSKNIVTGNHCYDLQDPKRQAYGIKSEGDYNIITNNQLWGNKTGGLSKVAADIEANNNTT